MYPLHAYWARRKSLPWPLPSRERDPGEHGELQQLHGAFVIGGEAVGECLDESLDGRGGLGRAVGAEVAFPDVPVRMEIAVERHRVGRPFFERLLMQRNRRFEQLQRRSYWPRSRASSAWLVSEPAWLARPSAEFLRSAGRCSAMASARR